jgi:3-phosphoshikimate 1-carboxyvinyltransferase
LDRIELGPIKSFKGELTPPPDKSISHRAVLFSSLANGTSLVKNFLAAEDPLSTIKAMKMLGISFDLPGPLAMKLDHIQNMSAKDSPGECSFDIAIHGKGLMDLREPFDVIDCGNSGTTIRLISGILAGNPFFSVLTGDDSLKQRPMARVMNPLKEMGAGIYGRNADKYPPLAIRGGRLRAIDYKMPMASAQVKSCIILAALYADGVTTITEPQKSRDHTERMLKAMGANIEVDDLVIKVTGRCGHEKGPDLSPIDITIPGDFSSAAFFIVASLIIPGSEIMIRNVGMNPTRTGLLEALKRMGAAVEIRDLRDMSGEPVADIYCRGKAGLKAIDISGEIIPSLIDEFPILCIAAASAEGTTTIRGAEELRVKESDRIKTMATELGKMGVEITEFPDGIRIKGPADLKGAEVESHNDHRIAMSMAVAALIAKGKTTINGASAVDISFPGFFDIIKRLSS